MAIHPEDFFEKLQKICLASGVKVIYTPFLSNAIKNASYKPWSVLRHIDPEIVLENITLAHTQSLIRLYKIKFQGVV